MRESEPRSKPESVLHPRRTSLLERYELREVPGRRDNVSTEKDYLLAGESKLE